MSDYDKWEAQQLQRSGLVSSKENPYYDEEAGGVVPAAEAEEDVEIEVIDDEPLFLRGQTTRAGPSSHPLKLNYKTNNKLLGTNVQASKKLNRIRSWALMSDITRATDVDFKPVDSRLFAVLSTSFYWDYSHLVFIRHAALPG